MAEAWWERALRSLGMNPMRLRWQLRRLGNRWERLSRRAENKGRAVRYANKVCPHCGLTVAADESRCPRCDQRVPSVAGRRIRLAWGLLGVQKGGLSYSPIFVALNVAFYFAMLMRSGGIGRLGQSLDPYVVVRFGAWTVPLVASGEVWRLVTPIFLHFGLLHLIFNCLWLIQLGPLVEETLGRSRYLLLYLLTGVIGFVATVGYRWEALRLVSVPGAGASGVVFGLIGAAVALGHLRRRPGTDALRGGWARWALYGLVFSLLPGVDLVAHLGGGAAGLLLGLVLADARQVRQLPRGLWLTLEVLCLVVIGVAFAMVILHPPARPPTPVG